MAIPAKVDLTCKISEVPPHWTTSAGIEFYLQDKGRILTVCLKPKQFKKLTSHSYADWIAAITGQLGPATETGFELVNASIQVFEKKSKSSAEVSSDVSKPKGAADSPASSPSVSSPALEPEPKLPGRKKLLHNVQIKNPIAASCGVCAAIFRSKQHPGIL